MADRQDRDLFFSQLYCVISCCICFHQLMVIIYSFLFKKLHLLMWCWLVVTELLLMLQNFKACVEDCCAI